MSARSGVPSTERACSRVIPAFNCAAASLDTKLPWTTVMRYGVTLCTARRVTVLYNEQLASRRMPHIDENRRPARYAALRLESFSILNISNQVINGAV